MRINKYLAVNGYCSRRQADELIKAGKVFINGRKADLGSQVEENNEIKVGDQAVRRSDNKKKIYIAYHKPVGVICTADRSKRDNIIEKINIKERIYPVGRLDVESSGLILLTNDGDFANKIMHPKYEHGKEYLVESDKIISKMEIVKLKKGIRLKEGIAKADKIRQITNNKLLITIHQGWSRQIRRMLEALGCQVISLKRIAIGHLKLADLPPGKWRNLSENEQTGLIKSSLPKSQKIV